MFTNFHFVFKAFFSGSVFFLLGSCRIKKVLYISRKKTIMENIKFDKAEEYEENYIFTSNSIDIYLDLIKLKAFIFDGEEFEVTNEEVDINKLLENKSFYYQLVCEFCNNTKGYDSSDNPCIERVEYCDCKGMNHELQEFYNSINK